MSKKSGLRERLALEFINIAQDFENVEKHYGVADMGPRQRMRLYREIADFLNSLPSNQEK